MDNKLITVIIPAYNVAAYLGECMESLCGQSYGELELILVDDGATDETPVLCDEWAAKDSRIKVIHKPNGGLSDARNAGLAAAGGEYISFIDPDDVVEKNMYETLFGLCRDNDTAMAVCRFDTFGADPGMEILPADGKMTVLTAEEHIRDIITYNEERPSSYSACTRLYRRDITEGLSFPKGKKYEDIVFSTKSSLKSGRLCYLNSFLYHYRIREDSISHDKSDRERDLIVHRLDQRRIQTAFLKESGETGLYSLAKAVYGSELKSFRKTMTLHEYDGLTAEILEEWKCGAGEIFSLPVGIKKKMKLLCGL
ncbi:MAG: glycosyltransferase [Lachnospiraceae bacterium]|nr:glycosyltransferase [Lachnospiraceae bacterium]